MVTGPREGRRQAIAVSIIFLIVCFVAWPFLSDYLLQTTTYCSKKVSCCIKSPSFTISLPYSTTTIDSITGSCIFNPTPCFPIKPPENFLRIVPRIQNVRYETRRPARLPRNRCMAHCQPCRLPTYHVIH